MNVYEVDASYFSQVRPLGIPKGRALKSSQLVTEKSLYKKCGRRIEI